MFLKFFKLTKLNKYFFFAIISTLISINTLYSQNDSLKSFKTKDFDLTYDTVLNNNGSTNPINVDFKLVDCNKIRLLTDTSLFINHSNGSDILIYNKILTLEVPTNKNYFAKGIGQGALVGLIAGLFFEVILMPFDLNASTSTTTANIVIYGIPTFTLLGAITGGMIGFYSTQYEIIEISKFPDEQKKEKFLSTILKLKIDF